MISILVIVAFICIDDKKHETIACIGYMKIIISTTGNIDLSS